MHVFNDSADVMQAAVHGIGAALARRRIAAPYLQRGELERLPGPALRARYAYYVVYPTRRPPSPVAALFIEWLKAQAMDEPAASPPVPASPRRAGAMRRAQALTTP